MAKITQTPKGIAFVRRRRREMEITLEDGEDDRWWPPVPLAAAAAMVRVRSDGRSRREKTTGGDDEWCAAAVVVGGGDVCDGHAALRAFGGRTAASDHGLYARRVSLLLYAGFRGVSIPLARVFRVTTEQIYVCIYRSSRVHCTCIIPWTRRKRRRRRRRRVLDDDDGDRRTRERRSDRSQRPAWTSDGWCGWWCSAADETETVVTPTLHVSVHPTAVAAIVMRAIRTRGRGTTGLWARRAAACRRRLPLAAVCTTFIL